MAARRAARCQADRSDRLDQQDDRGHHGRQPRQRHRDEQVAERLRCQRRVRRARHRLARGGVRSRSPIASPTTAATSGRRDRGDRHRPGRPPRIATTEPDDQQIPRVAQRGGDAEHDAQRRVRAVRAGPDAPQISTTPTQHDRHRDQGLARRPLPEHQPRDDARRPGPGGCRGPWRAPPRRIRSRGARTSGHPRRRRRR